MVILLQTANYYFRQPCSGSCWVAGRRCVNSTFLYHTTFFWGLNNRPRDFAESHFLTIQAVMEIRAPNKPDFRNRRVRRNRRSSGVGAVDDDAKVCSVDP